MLPSWRNTPLEERKAILYRFGELLRDEQEDCAQTLTREMGKPIAQARNEIAGTLKRINFFLGAVDEVIHEQTIISTDEIREKICFEPLGVVANISAWNYPYFVGSNVYVPALLTGNTVLYKPSELALFSGKKVASLFAKAGLPDGVLQLVCGAGDVGTHLLNQDIQGVFFTGSVATGQKIAASVAPRFIRTEMELGGKDPAYVCNDVDIAKTAEMLADGAFYNAGQSCCAVERIYVHEAVFDAFLEAFCAVVRKYAMGDPRSEKTYLGPLARQSPLKFLSDQVADATAKGARVLLEGGVQSGKGWFFKPVVLTNVDHSMTIMREESFGPVIGIQKVRDDSEALKWMQDTTYGLTASVCTRDEQRAEKILSAMETGTVYWNACDRVSPFLPWTGRKNSGLGTTLSKLGLQSFVHVKAWHLRRA